MTSDTIFGRSFSQHDQRKLGCWAFAICLSLGVTILTVFEPFIRNNLNLLMGFTDHAIEEPQASDCGIKKVQAICDLTGPRSDVCELNGDIRIDVNSSTIFIAPTQADLMEDRQFFFQIKPYARKQDSIAMGRVRTITIKTAEAYEGIPNCSRNYINPAILFSTGPYARNQFHAFADLLLPLYLSSVQFNGEVRFLFTDYRISWVEKHREKLQKLTNYDLIDIDQGKEVLCFPRIIVGLKATRELGIDPSQSSNTMKYFREFLRSAYSLRRESTMSKYNPTPSPNAHKNNTIHHDDGHEGGRRPRLLLISRNKTRRLINAGEIAAMAESVGFDVVVNETDSRESEVAEFVNSYDVLVGVHGAGLTNMVYLPENAVVIQIIPLLGEMEWIAKRCYENPTSGMNLKYFDYKISPNESSLIQQFPIDHEVFKDPGAITKRGWLSFKSVYLDNQDLKVDISRFKETLLKAHEFLSE